MLRYRTSRQEFRQMAAGVGATKVLLIRSGEGGVAVFALDAVSGEKIWVGEYSPKLRDNHELARAIVKDFVVKQKNTTAAAR